jgi:AraC-like DNA-binding protein
VAVADDLTDRLSIAWAVNTDVAHDLVPDACVDVVWLSDGSVQVCGPELEGWTFHVGDGTEAVGVRFRPGQAGPVLGVGLDEIRDQQVPAEDLLGPDGRRLVEELDELGESASQEARIALLQAHIRGWIDEAHGSDPVSDQLTATLADDPATRVDTLARDLDLSERQLLRRCTVAFGYGPATLRRILRLQRFLALAGDGHTGATLAELALAAGYTDQQHLARDARAIGRASPTELLANRRNADMGDSAESARPGSN